MGKTVLLLLAAVTISGTILSLGQAEISVGTNESHQLNAAQVYAREMSDAGTNAVLTAVTADGAFDPMAPFPICSTFTYGGGKYQLLGYGTRKQNREAEFVVRGFFPYRMNAAGTALEDTSVTLRSVYRWRPNVWPGPFPIGASAFAGQMGSGSSINGADVHEGEYYNFPAFFGHERYDRYGVDEMLDWDDMLGNMNSNIGSSIPINTPGVGSDFDNMNDLYAHYNSPTPRAIIQAAPGTMGANDVDLALLPRFIPQAAEDWYTFTPQNGADIAYNPNGLSSAPLIMISEKPMKIDSGFTVSGRGLLMVKHGLEVEGTLNWDGMVIVHSKRDTLLIRMDKSEGGVNINGSLVIEHDAPPPGGHMDLTVFRDLDHAWATPMGVHSSGNRNNLRHTHRFGNEGGGWHEGSNSWQSCGSNGVCPAESRPPGEDAAARRIIFREPGLLAGVVGSQHENHTQFSSTLASLGSRPIYLEFGDANAVQNYDGYTDAALQLYGEPLCTGTAQGGFSNLCRDSSRPHRTRVFNANQLESLVLDIGSLRMLKRLTNRDPLGPNDPYNEMPAQCPNNHNKMEAWLGPLPSGINIDFKTRSGECVSDNYPNAVGFLESRGGVLRLQIKDGRTAHDGKLLYEAAMYWHTKEPGHQEHTEEAAADLAFYQAIANGEDYGVRFEAGDGLTINFQMDVIDPLLSRLNLDEETTVERSNAQIERVNNGAAAVPTATCPVTS